MRRSQRLKRRVPTDDSCVLTDAQADGNRGGHKQMAAKEGQERKVKRINSRGDLGSSKKPQKTAAQAEVVLDAGALSEEQKVPVRKHHKGGPSQEKEEALWKKGFNAVGGLDEAGRGPLAGPVVAAICVLPRNAPESLLQGLNDSKLLDEGQREALYARITSMPGVLWAAQVIDSTTIDRVNILQAALQAMREAALQLPRGSFDFLLVDGNKVPEQLPVPAEAVVKGDGTCSCIAAASIIAKVTRDRIMVALHATFPAYNFRQHKGYGVPEHIAAIRTHGPCAIHRRSFQPIRGITGWTRAKQLAEEAAAVVRNSKEGGHVVTAENAGMLRLEAAIV